MQLLNNITRIMYGLLSVFLSSTIPVAATVDFIMDQSTCMIGPIRDTKSTVAAIGIETLK